MGAPIPARLATNTANPIPKFAQVNYIATAFGNLRYVICQDESKEAKGTAIIAHGYSECIEKYYHVIDALMQRNYAVAMCDWRGHGNSETFIDEEADFFRLMDIDFDDFIQQKINHQLPRPYIGVAHSMGGCLTLSAAHSNPEYFDAIILSSPMLGIKNLRKYPFLRLVAKIVCLFNSSYDLPSKEIRYTSDINKYNRFQTLLKENKDLYRNFNQFRWFASAAKRLKTMQGTNWYKKIKTPALFLVAGNETLVVNDNSIAAAKDMEHAQLEIIDNALHEVFMETEQIQTKIWKLIDNFLADNLPK